MSADKAPLLYPDPGMHPQAEEAEAERLEYGCQCETVARYWYHVWKSTPGGWWSVLPKHLPAWWMHPNTTPTDPRLGEVPVPTSVWEAMAVQTAAWKQLGVQAPVWYTPPPVLPHRGELLGTLSEEMRRCGKASCMCASDPAAMHGPYTYRRFRDAAGQEHRSYVSPEDVEAVQSGIDARVQRLKRESAVRELYMREVAANSSPNVESVMQGAELLPYPAWEAFSQRLEAKGEQFVLK